MCVCRSRWAKGRPGGASCHGAGGGGRAHLHGRFCPVSAVLHMVLPASLAVRSLVGGAAPSSQAFMLLRTFVGTPLAPRGQPPYDDLLAAPLAPLAPRGRLHWRPWRPGGGPPAGSSDLFSISSFCPPPLYGDFLASLCGFFLFFIGSHGNPAYNTQCQCLLAEKLNTEHPQAVCKVL